MVMIDKVHRVKECKQCKETDEILSLIYDYMLSTGENNRCTQGNKSKLVKVRKVTQINNK